MSKKYYDKILAGSGTSQVKVKSVFGAKILSKYGWKEGEGLGSSMNGVKECVQVEKRAERIGIGAEKKESSSEWDNWWCGAYDSVASKIAIKVAKKKKRNEEFMSSDHDDEDGVGKKRDNEKESSLKRRRVKRQVRSED